MSECYKGFVGGDAETHLCSDKNGHTGHHHCKIHNVEERDDVKVTDAGVVK